jgi:hypothetical protein
MSWFANETVAVPASARHGDPPVMVPEDPEAVDPELPEPDPEPLDPEELPEAVDPLPDPPPPPELGAQPAAAAEEEMAPTDKKTKSMRDINDRPFERNLSKASRREPLPYGKIRSHSALVGSRTNAFDLLTF